MRSNWHSIRGFEALRATIAAGTTTGAARRLGLSQSAVSRALADLEARTGRMLFERDGGRIQPTSEALSLNASLDPLFAALERIDGGDWAAEPEETLRIVAPPTLAHRLLLRGVSRFLGANAHARVSLEICTSDEIVSGILDGRFDIGVTGSSISRSGMKLVPWRTARAVCVMQATHPLAALGTVRPGDMDGVAMVALGRRHSVRAQLDQIFAAAGASPRIVVETATTVSAAEFARSGLGVSVINPFPILKGGETDLAVRPFAPVIDYLTSFAVSSTRTLPPLVRLFMRHLRMTTPKDPYSETV